MRDDVDKLVKRDGTLTCSDRDVANCLNDFFTSVYTHEAISDIPNLPDRSNGNTLQHIKVTHQDILDQLHGLKPNKSCGPDNCHPQVLKNVKDGLIVTLYYLCNKSLEEAILPFSWKEATITPIFKKGDRKLSNNYHPISLPLFSVECWRLLLKTRLCRILQSTTFLQ